MSKTTDDSPLPKPPTRPEPNNPECDEGVPAWQIVLVFVVIIVFVLFVVAGGAQ